MSSPILRSRETGVLKWRRGAVSAPQHQQLAEVLLGQIARGEIAVGARLPTEAELCAEHGLARGTVRQALGRIESLGMITRRPGTGSTVIARAPLTTYHPAVRSLEDIATLAAGTRLSHPSSSDVRLDAVSAARLGARRGSLWFKLEGVRMIRGSDGPPLCWSEHYLRGDIDRRVMLRGPTPEGLHSMRTQQEISAGFLPAEIADALGVPRGGAALIVTRRHRDLKKRLVGVGIHTHPAERYSILTEI